MTTPSPAAPRASSTFAAFAAFAAIATACLLAFASPAPPAGAADASSAAPGKTAPPELADASTDRVHAVVAVPDPNRRVGVVRLLSRGDGVVVQTLLDTRLLSRAVAEIRAKEKRAWGEGDAASAAYVAALDSALAEVERRPADEERRRRLLVEFAADAGGEAVLVGTFAAFEDRAMAHPSGREVFATLAPPRAWVLREIRLVVADAFDVPDSEVDRVGPLGPAGAPAATPSAAPAALPGPAGADAPHGSPR